MNLLSLPKRAHPKMKLEALKDPTPQGNTVLQSTDRKIPFESVMERKISALSSPNKAALGQDVADAEPNDAGDEQRDLLQMKLGVRANGKSDPLVHL